MGKALYIDEVGDLGFPFLGQRLFRLPFIPEIRSSF